MWKYFLKQWCLTIKLFFLIWHERKAFKCWLINTTRRLTLITTRMYGHLLDRNDGVPKTPNLFTKKIPVKSEFLTFSFAVFGDMGQPEGLETFFLAGQIFKIFTHKKPCLDWSPPQELEEARVAGCTLNLPLKKMGHATLSYWMNYMLWNMLRYFC